MVKVARTRCRFLGTVHSQNTVSDPGAMLYRVVRLYPLRCIRGVSHKSCTPKLKPRCAHSAGNQGPASLSGITLLAQVSSSFWALSIEERKRSFCPACRLHTPPSQSSTIKFDPVGMRPLVPSHGSGTEKTSTSLFCGYLTGVCTVWP